MKEHYIVNDIVSQFIMIEPSRASLSQVIKYLQAFCDDCEIASYNTTAGKVTLDNLQTEAETIIHIFSNVLDMLEFEREHIAELLNQDVGRNHILVSMSPFYQEKGRGALMDDFHAMTRGMRCEYKYGKHIRTIVVKLADRNPGKDRIPLLSADAMNQLFAHYKRYGTSTSSKRTKRNNL